MAILNRKASTRDLLTKMAASFKQEMDYPVIGNIYRNSVYIAGEPQVKGGKIDVYMYWEAEQIQERRASTIQQIVGQELFVVSLLTGATEDGEEDYLRLMDMKDNVLDWMQGSHFQSTGANGNPVGVSHRGWAEFQDAVVNYEDPSYPRIDIRGMIAYEKQGRTSIGDAISSVVAPSTAYPQPVWYYDVYIPPAIKGGNDRKVNTTPIPYNAGDSRNTIWRNRLDATIRKVVTDAGYTEIDVIYKNLEHGKTYYEPDVSNNPTFDDDPLIQIFPE